MGGEVGFSYLNLKNISEHPFYKVLQPSKDLKMTRNSKGRLEVSKELKGDCCVHSLKI